MDTLDALDSDRFTVLLSCLQAGFAFGLFLRRQKSSTALMIITLETDERRTIAKPLWVSSAGHEL